MRLDHPTDRIDANLRNKVRLFYDNLNRGDFERCYRTIDPLIRKSDNAVKFPQYMRSAEEFLKKYQNVQIRNIDRLRLHLNEPNRLYNNRDFAVFQIEWEDGSGQRHTALERWVRHPSTGWWYTRSTGFTTRDL